MKKEDDALFLSCPTNALGLDLTNISGSRIFEKLEDFAKNLKYFYFWFSRRVKIFDKFSTQKHFYKGKSYEHTSLDL